MRMFLQALCMRAPTLAGGVYVYVELPMLIMLTADTDFCARSCLSAFAVPPCHNVTCGVISAITENTRASYPIEHIENARIPCVGPHPRNVVLLCCDAFGVLPPVSKLSLEQVMYHFISGYTSKVRPEDSCCIDCMHGMVLVRPVPGRESGPSRCSVCCCRGL